MITFIIKNNKKYIYTFFSILFLLFLWSITSFFLNKPIIIPSPLETFLEMRLIISNKDFFIIVFNTLMRLFIGFSITLILAIILGLMAGLYRSINIFLNPIVIILKSVPTMAVILIVLIWLDSETAPLLVTFLITFPIIYQNVLSGILNVDKKLIEMARIYKISKFKTIKEIYLPSINSYLSAGISTAIGINMKVIIATEVLSQPKFSIGTSFQIESSNLNTAGVFAWAIIAISIVAIIEFILKLLKIKRRKKTK